VSGKRLSKTEKLQLLQRVVLHLYAEQADVRWIPVVQRFVERWNTRKETPATIQSPVSQEPVTYQELIQHFKLDRLLDTHCPKCGWPTRLTFLVRTASGALRCGDCQDKMTTEKKENQP